MPEAQVLEKPKWRLTAKAFLAPNMMKEGTIFYYSGEPGPHFEPLNEAAIRKFKTYVAEHPEAMIGHPTNALPLTMEQVEIISVPDGRSMERALTVEEMAEGKAAKPIRSIFDVMERVGETIPDDPEYGGRSDAELSAADQIALAEVVAGADKAKEERSKALETKQAKGTSSE